VTGHRTGWPHARALWGLAAFALLVALATDRGTLGIALAITAAVIIELLTSAGALGAGKSDRP
jgi:hypothetical protein